MQKARRLIVLLMSLCLIIGSSVMVSAATAKTKADLTKAGIKYYITGSKTAAVKIQNKKATVKIPETVKIKGKKYTVTAIRSTAIAHDTVAATKLQAVARDYKEYFKNTKTRNIIIPKTVKKIETGAFSYFTKLKSVKVAKDNKTFMTTKKGLYSRNGKTLYLAFNGTGTYKVKSGVVKIAPRAFVATKYKKVILPDSCEAIGSRAFFKCSNLSSISLGGVYKCGNYAFYGTKVKNVDQYGTMRFSI